MPVDKHAKTRAELLFLQHSSCCSAVCVSVSVKKTVRGGALTPCLVYGLVIYSPSALYVRGNIPIF